MPSLLLHIHRIHQRTQGDAHKRNERSPAELERFPEDHRHYKLGEVRDALHGVLECGESVSSGVVVKGGLELFGLDEVKRPETYTGECHAYENEKSILRGGTL